MAYKWNEERKEMEEHPVLEHQDTRKRQEKAFELLEEFMRGEYHTDDAVEAACRVLNIRQKPRFGVWSNILLKLPRPYPELFTPAKLKNKLSLNDFVFHLLSLDDRIAFSDHPERLTGKSDFGLGVSKQYILFPTFGLVPPDHELAHFVEMQNKKRWLLPDLGMKIRPLLKDKVSPTFLFATLARETRVDTLAFFFVGKRRRSFIARDKVAPIVEKALPFGRFRDLADVIQWEETIVSHTLRDWSKDRIEHEWKMRIAFFREYMDTDAPPLEKPPTPHMDTDAPPLEKPPAPIGKTEVWWKKASPEEAYQQYLKDQQETPRSSI